MSRALGLLALLLIAAPAAQAAPIVDPLPTTLPTYQGAPAQPRPLTPTRAPQNPFLAPDPRSNIHNDTWMTDAYAWAGPLGRSPRAFSGAMPPALCGSLTFHSQGYLVGVCPSLVAPPQVRVIDPDTLELLATYDMPNAPDPPGTRAYQNFAGGGYFFLDDSDRIWSSTKTSHLFVLKVARDGRSITKLRDYDLEPRAGLRRAHLVRTARLPRAHLVRVEEERQGRHPQPAHAPGPGAAAGRGHPELVHDRPRRHLRGVEPAHVSLQRAQRPPAGGLEGALRELRHRQAGPGRRRLGHHADDHEGRLRGDHRQRGPDERGRLPQGQAAARKAAGGLRGAGVRARCERHGELADHRRSLALRGEQLRLPGPVRADERCAYHAGPGARGREPSGHRAAAWCGPIAPSECRRWCRSCRPAPA